MYRPDNPNYYDLRVSLEITDKCKLKCPNCARQTFPSSLKVIKDITLKDYDKIVDAFSSVSLCGTFSDPIYHPKFHDILIASRYLKQLHIHTNGSGKTQEWWRKAFQISVDMGNVEWQFALDGLPNESHIYRIGQDGLQVWEMMKLGSEMGANITWQYIPFLYNQDHVEQARKMAEEHGIKFFLKISSRHPEGMTPTRKEYAIERIRVAD